ncbi:Invertebrate defensins family profile domain-containing protein [Corallococcus soli]
MLPTAKKIGKTLLALTTGAVLSFGATMAFAAPEASVKLCIPAECNSSCQASGAAGGACLRGQCGCYFF